MLSDPRTFAMVNTAVVIVVVVTFVMLATTDATAGAWWIAAGVLLCVGSLVVWFVYRARQ